MNTNYIKEWLVQIEQNIEHNSTHAKVDRWKRQADAMLAQREETK